MNLAHPNHIMVSMAMPVQVPKPTDRDLNMVKFMLVCNRTLNSGALALVELTILNNQLFLWLICSHCHLGVRHMAVSGGLFVADMRDAYAIRRLE